MNGYIWISQDELEVIMGSFGRENRKPEQSTMLEFCLHHKWQVLNMYFQNGSDVGDEG